MVLNGKFFHLEAPMSLLEYLESNNFPTTIAVEKNGKIIERTEFSEEILQDSDVLEVVRFVGGG